MVDLELIAYGTLVIVMLLTCGGVFVWCVVQFLVLWATRPERTRAVDNERRSQLRWAARIGKPKKEIDLLRRAWKM